MSKSYPTGRYFESVDQRQSDARKDRFARLKDHVRNHGGWTTSVPGKRYIDFEVLPGSPLRDDLRAQGYTVEPDGFGERILPHLEWFLRAGDGSLELLTKGGTKPIASRVTQSGPCAG
jgi:hypothetical protein